MNSPKILKQCGCFCLSLFLLICTASALEERFYVATDTYKNGEEGEVTRYSLFTDSARIFFRPPYKWKLSTNVEQRTVLFLSPNQSVAVKMQIESNVSCENLDELRNAVKSRYVNGIITDESTIYTAGGNAALRFDIQWINDFKISVTTRLIFVPTQIGTVEFSMATGSSNFEANAKAIDNIASSFRLESVRAKELAKE